MRRYRPAPLALRAAPAALIEETAMCPSCCGKGAVIGRMGLRLVFRCGRCRVRFHRSPGRSGDFH